MTHTRPFRPRLARDPHELDRKNPDGSAGSSGSKGRELLLFPILREN